MEFFRHCPQCGRRFHIKLESKKPVSLDREPVTMPITAGGKFQGSTLWEDRTITLDIEVFDYVFKCGHCGHEWSEKHSEEHRES